MWLLIIAAVLIYIFRPRLRIKKVYYSKPAKKDKPIAEVLDDLVRRGMNKPFDTGPHIIYVQIKLRLLLMNDTRFKNINRAFREGYTQELPDYAFTEENHGEADIYYNRAYWRYNKEFRNRVELLWKKRSGVTHVYICPNLGKRCDSVKKIEKPKMYPIDQVPIIPCADCTEPMCYCSYISQNKNAE